MNMHNNIPFDAPIYRERASRLRAEAIGEFFGAIGTYLTLYPNVKIQKQDKNNHERTTHIVVSNNF